MGCEFFSILTLKGNQLGGVFIKYLGKPHNFPMRKEVNSPLHFIEHSIIYFGKPSKFP